MERANFTIRQRVAFASHWSNPLLGNRGKNIIVVPTTSSRLIIVTSCVAQMLCRWNGSKRRRELIPFGRSSHRDNADSCSRTLRYRRLRGDLSTEHFYHSVYTSVAFPPLIFSRPRLNRSNCFHKLDFAHCTFLSLQLRSYPYKEMYFFIQMIAIPKRRSFSLLLLYGECSCMKTVR